MVVHRTPSSHPFRKGAELVMSVDFPQWNPSDLCRIYKTEIRLTCRSCISTGLSRVHMCMTRERNRAPVFTSYSHSLRRTRESAINCTRCESKRTTKRRSPLPPRESNRPITGHAKSAVSYKNYFWDKKKKIPEIKKNILRWHVNSANENTQSVRCSCSVIPVIR